MGHPKGSQAACDHMEKIRKVKLVKGSEESKLFMQELRNKRKSKKDLSNINNVTTNSKG
jgi:hypothetical protein